MASTLDLVFLSVYRLSCKLLARDLECLKTSVYLVSLKDEKVSSWFESNLSSLILSKDRDSVASGKQPMDADKLSEAEKRKIAAKARQEEAMAKMLKAQEEAMNRLKDLEKDDLYDEGDDEDLFEESEASDLNSLPRGRCLLCQ